MENRHSVTLDKNSCTGCTNCLKQCPTQAIRVQNGKAKILSERCIDCGECIRVCPYHAKKALTDPLESIQSYEHKVALVAPAFFGQFSKAEQLDVMLSALLEIGFDDVFEVARGAEMISKKTRELLASGELLTPTISSACPAVVSLIAVRFPNLIGNVIPLRSPMEVSAKEARKEAMEKTGLPKEKIGIFFISPCAAKATAVKCSANVEASEVDGVIAIKDVYLRMAQQISTLTADKVQKLSKSGADGVLWATAGGEAHGTYIDRKIAVDGIDNVIKILEAIDDGKLSDIDFVELLACPTGCVGGPLTTENNFLANSRIKWICKNLPPMGEESDSEENLFWDHPVTYRSVMNLDPDITVAMQKALEMERIFDRLPKLDCGSCGSPSCKDLAEDIVRGNANENDCIFRLREKISALAREMVALDTQEQKTNEEDETV